MDLKNLALIDPSRVFKEGDSFFCPKTMVTSCIEQYRDYLVEDFIAVLHTSEKSQVNWDICKVTLKKRNPDFQEASLPSIYPLPRVLGEKQIGGKRNPTGWQHRAANVFKQVGVGQGWIFSCGTNDGQIHRVIKGILSNVLGYNKLRCLRAPITLVNTSTMEVLQGYYVEAVEAVCNGERS